ncbi:hypothetical protein ACQPW3_19980 [Actinosynnema sp. CA-248983]
MKRTAVLAAALVTLLGVLVAPAQAVPASARVGMDLAKVRLATVHFHNVQTALDAGYVPAGDCVPGMGFHYFNPALAGPGLDIERPELLVYAPTPSGRLRLVAVEWFQVDADGRTDTDFDRPFLFGVGFDGPMEGHGPDMPVHYDLHAWVWEHNPDGMFTAFNPRIVC